MRLNYIEICQLIQRACGHATEQTNLKQVNASTMYIAYPIYASQSIDCFVITCIHVLSGAVVVCLFVSFFIVFQLRKIVKIGKTTNSAARHGASLPKLLVCVHLFPIGLCHTYFSNIILCSMPWESFVFPAAITSIYFKWFTGGSGLRHYCCCCCWANVQNIYGYMRYAKTHYERRTSPGCCRHRCCCCANRKYFSKWKWHSNKFSMTAHPKVAATAAAVVIKINKIKQNKEEKKTPPTGITPAAATNETKEPISILSSAFSISNGTLSV